MKKYLLLAFIAFTFISCNKVISSKDIEKMDSRNVGVDMEVKYKNLFNRDVIIFDIRSISKMNSMSDVFRCFLQSAENLKDKKFDKVEFAYKGNSKMYIKGSYFKILGNEFGIQNVIYTIRTFPENVKMMDGSPAFDKWEGGFLGVTSRQMEDFNEFHKQWYLNESIY